MITRTYPSETSLFDGDELIIRLIREKIGDKPKLTRFVVAPGSPTMEKYVMPDNLTFYNEVDRFWPYHLSVSGTTYSGIQNPQVLNYHYLSFDSPVSSLAAVPLDFWVENFFVSDYEIWTAFLSVDLTALVRKPECVTEEMEILKAAIDLLPVVRMNEQDRLYAVREVTDGDQRYKTSMGGSRDPYKDRVKDLQDELDRLIYECNHRPYFGGVRIE